MEYPQWMSDEARKILQSGYLQPGETAYGMYRRIANVVSEYTNADVGEDLYWALTQGWLGPATPVAANLGTNRGLPVSCYGIHLSDSIPGIYDGLKEAAVMSQNGGGLGVYFGDIRPSGSPISRGGTASSVLNWMIQFDSMASRVSQNNTRRGAVAVYLPVDHPDLPAVLNAKNLVDGDYRQKLNCNVGVTITDAFMKRVLSNDAQAVSLFSAIMRSREENGSPYIVFIDTVNRNRPEAYVRHGLKVSTSQLCSEITLYTDSQHSYTCVLSSLNLDKWLEWRNWTGKSGFTVPQLGIVLLDAANEEFIRRSREVDKRHGDNSFERARRGAIKGRPLGLGVMGLGSLFQRLMLPFDSPDARELNKKLFKEIKEQALEASAWLAKRLGEPEWCAGLGLRNTHLLAVAPTMTNAVISGANSAGIEPPVYNFYTVSGEKSVFIRYNRVLKDYLEANGLGYLWERVVAADGGSVQDLPLSSEVKAVFRTAYEVPQHSLIQMQADREPWLCQAASFNLFNAASTSDIELASQVIVAWKLGVKTLYYNRSNSKLSKVAVDTKMFPHLSCSYECKVCES